MRLIDADDLKQRLEDMLKDMEDKWNDERCYAVRYAISLLDEECTSTYDPWTRIDQNDISTLPQQAGLSCLLTVKRNNNRAKVIKAFTSYGDQQRPFLSNEAGVDFRGLDVIAWMTLPDPYKEYNHETD